MLNLFSLDEDFNVVITPEALTLTPFKKIMDKYKVKRYGKAELSYIWFMVDYRSIYLDIVDTGRRKEEVLSALYEGDKVIVDKKTEAAIEFYEANQPSMSHKHLKAIKKALVTLQDSLNKIDMSIEVEDAITGKIEPVYNTMDLNRISTIIKESPKLISAIKEMEQQVKTELQENSTHVGSGQKSIYEDE